MEIKDVEENYKYGWIKIYRSIKNHWIWHNDQYFKIWVDFLMRANHSDNKFLVDSRLIQVEKGTFITSLKKLAKEYKTSIGKIRHFLILLQNDFMIDLKTTHKFTQITICNYGTYQDKQQAERNGNEMGMKRERNGNETNKNEENVKNDKNDKKITEAYFESIFNLYRLEFVNLLTFDKWKEWVDYRTEIRKKVTKSTAEKQILFLIKQPNPTRCIDESITNGWQGLFPTKHTEKKYEYQKGDNDGFKVIGSN